MDRGAWWAIVHGVAESDTTEQLSMTTRQDSSHIYYWKWFQPPPPTLIVQFHKLNKALCYKKRGYFPLCPLRDFRLPLGCQHLRAK